MNGFISLAPGLRRTVRTLIGLIRLGGWFQAEATWRLLLGAAAGLVSGAAAVATGMLRALAATLLGVRTLGFDDGHGGGGLDRGHGSFSLVWFVMLRIRLYTVGLAIASGLERFS